MNKLTALIEAAKAASVLDHNEGAEWYEADYIECNGAFYRKNAKFIALANPATILELCALLETCEAALLEAEDFCSAKHVGFQNLDDALAAIKQWKEKT